MFLKVLGYERGSDITEGDITEVRVYKHPRIGWGFVALK
jgi:hypothetical protein